MKVIRLCAPLFAFLFLFLCCGSPQRGTGIGEAIHMRHARHLSICLADGYTLVEMQDPWDTTRVMHTYVLVPADSALPIPLPQGTLVRTPLRRVGVSTSVHASLLTELGCVSSIVGMCEPQYILDSVLSRRIHDGDILDFGAATNPNIERMMLARLDAIFLTPFNSPGGYGSLENLGIPIIECAEYMETTALGEAEWMRFYALLMGCEERGDSLFDAIEARYLALADSTSSTSIRPRVMTEMMMSGTWYVPGGQSTIARMINDAGGDYIFATTPGSGSVPLPFETVFARGAAADIWLIKYSQCSPLTLRQLAQDYAPYTYFKAFGNQQVWGCNLIDNRYYTDIPFHPDRLLQEYREIIQGGHPQHSHGYYERLQ